MNHLAFFVSAFTTSENAPAPAPGLFWCLPFVALLLSIALLPLIPRCAHWWEHNRNKLIVSVVLGLVVMTYYTLSSGGYGGYLPGWPSLGQLIHHAILNEYIPFIILLFSLYTISGGIRLDGDIPAHPTTNCLFLLAGAILANIIGTTGASVLLIRPLLHVNAERRHVTHTIVFFIFLVSNIGGCLTPIGDPPLFLGYLRGVPFVWTLKLFPLWLTAVGLLLCVYYGIERIMYKKERKTDVQQDERIRKPFQITGRRNFLLMAGVIASVCFLVPGQKLPFTNLVVPNIHLREVILLVLAGLSIKVTPLHIHKANGFGFGPILEVAFLFIGIFITMQPAIEILRANGAALGVTSPLQFFWGTGLLSSFLDNAPTYVVFFELAGVLPPADGNVLHQVATGSTQISAALLLAISAGSVFMGANTYIGNGPNFLVKSIAEERGVPMPGFFGYMLYSLTILIPLFVVISLIFFR